MPMIEISDEEIIRDKQNIRVQLLNLVLKNDEEAIDQQKVFIHKMIRAPWLLEKIQKLLDRITMYDGDNELGNIYRTILFNEYFTDIPEKDWQMANTLNVSEGVIEYRKREAIKLFEY